MLNAYLEWGEDFVDKIDGMFAIALWDARARQLKLYRDRPGIKPLYYYHDGRRFAFASELKAIEIACAAEKLEVDGSALYDFLGYRYVPAPKTLYRRCYKLPPAHWLVFDPATGVVQGPQRFWSIPLPETPRRPPLEEGCAELRALIARRRLRSDDRRRAARLLSLGRHRLERRRRCGCESGRKVSTFSIGFDSDAVSETPYAREVAQLFHTDHHERILSQAHAQELLPKLKSLVRRAIRGRIVDADVSRLGRGSRERHGRA